MPYSRWRSYYTSCLSTPAKRTTSSSGRASSSSTASPARLTGSRRCWWAAWGPWRRCYSSSRTSCSRGWAGCRTTRTTDWQPVLFQVCDDVMETAWSTMWNVTDETPVNCERFLNGGGMYLFLKCKVAGSVIVCHITYISTLPGPLSREGRLAEEHDGTAGECGGGALSEAQADDQGVCGGICFPFRLLQWW